MTGALALAFPGQEAPAGRLAGALGLPCETIAVHAFPDGESLVRVAASAELMLLYCSLDDPNRKLVELLLAAAAARDQGARRLVLVAPYLCYLRQDTAFHPGEAVSQAVIGRLLAASFDRVVTVDPHLHRTPRLSAVLPGIEAQALTAAPLLTGLLWESGAESSRPLLVGPDAESRQWVEQVAAGLKAEVMVGAKIRDGDRLVRVALPRAGRARGRPVFLVDDVISSGATLGACAQLLRQAGAGRIEALATHCLCTPTDLAALEAAGVERVRSTDSVLHPTNAVALAPLLAEALRGELAR